MSEFGIEYTNYVWNAVKTNQPNQLMLIGWNYVCGI